MPNEIPAPEDPEVPPESPSAFFGDAEYDATPWLIRWVKVNLAEHHSDLHDALPKGAITLIVVLTLQGMQAANEALAGPNTEEPNG